MGIKQYATGVWNGIKKGPTQHTDGYFAAAGTTIGSAVLGGIFGGAEGAMMASAATASASSAMAGINAMYNLSWRKGTKDLARVAGEASTVGESIAQMRATLIESTVGGLPARTFSLGTKPLGKVDQMQKISARVGLHTGAFLNDTVAALKSDVIKPTISSAKKMAHGDFGIGHRGVIGSTLAATGATAATSFGMLYSASGGNAALAAISSSAFAAGSFLAPHINKALDEKSAIKQAITRYGPKKLLMEGGVEGVKAAGSYVAKGNAGAITRLQKIKDSFSAN